MIYDKVVELICEQLPIKKDKITLDSRLLEDLGADSANVMILVMDLEQAFDITVDDDVLQGISTVGDIVDYLKANTGKD